MKPHFSNRFCLAAAAAAFPLLVQAAEPASSKEGTLIVQAESGKFTGIIDRHSCWHNVMLTDEPHSTHSGEAIVDTKNEVGSYVEVDYVATWAGPHRITARYTHPRGEPRPADLLVNGQVVATLALPQNRALPAYKTDSTVVELKTGTNVLRLSATTAGGLPNTDYLKVAEVREVGPDSLPRIQILEAEAGRYTGKLDHHSCWNFIAQTKALHSGFTGEGYVDSLNEIGSYCEIKFTSKTAGPHQLGLRYVHVKDDLRTVEVRVNGTVANPALNFPQTGAWTAWTNISTPVTLQTGTNVIRLTGLTTNGLVNLDRFEFTAGAK